MISSCRFRRSANPSGLERRSSATRALLAVIIGLGVGLGAAGESAAQQRVQARLVWGGSMCGSADDFEARVGKRTNAVRFVPRGQRLEVRASIERRGQGLEARASIEARGREPIVRRIASPDCDDALDALALVVAIGVEGSIQQQRAAPRARRRPARRAAPEPPVNTPVPLQPHAAEDAPAEVPVVPEPSGPSSASGAAPEPTPRLEPATLPPPEPTAPVPAPPRALEVSPAAPREAAIDSAPASRPSAVDLRLGLVGAVSIGVAPQPLLGGGLWLAVAWLRDGIWSPEVMLGAQHQRLDGLTLLEGRANFALSVASLALCPLRIGNERFAVRPCASGALGRLEGDGFETFDARSFARPWGAVGGTLEGLARVGVFEFRAAFGATAPLSRDSFSFGERCVDPSLCSADVFHHVEPVVWSGALGAGVRVW